MESRARLNDSVSIPSGLHLPARACVPKAPHHKLPKHHHEQGSECLKLQTLGEILHSNPNSQVAFRALINQYITARMHRSQSFTALLECEREI